MTNIIENNKLIAEFLDWEFDDLSETFETTFLKLVEPQAFGDEQFSSKLQDFELEFHSDWNWLMPVVEKIESENIVCFKFQGNNCYCEGNFKYGITAPSKINAVYNACVEFIKWYNNKNKVS